MDKYRISQNIKIILPPLVLCLLFPPIISIIVLFYNFCKSRRKQIGILLSVFFVLFITYNTYSVDNTLRLWNAYDKYDETEWYLGDPLTNVLRLFLSMGIECSFLFYFYILCIYILWLSTLFNIQKKWNAYIILIFLFGMILRNAVDLVYYTLSLTALLFLITRKEIVAKDYLYIIPILYLLHPGILLIAIPSIILYYIIKRGNKTFYYSYLILLFLLFFSINKIEIPHTGILLIDSMTESLTLYTDSENRWGMQEKDISGFGAFLKYYGMTIGYLILFYYTIKYKERINQKHLLAIYQVAFIALLGLWNFVTITERNMVVLSLSCWPCLLLLIQSKSFSINNPLRKYKTLAALACIIFILNIYKITPIRLNKIFINQSYTSIQKRSYYIPSVLLFNIKELGFSDTYVKQNSTLKRFEK